MTCSDFFGGYIGEAPQPRGGSLGQGGPVGGPPGGWDLPPGVGGYIVAVTLSSRSRAHRAPWKPYEAAQPRVSCIAAHPHQERGFKLLEARRLMITDAPCVWQLKVPAYRSMVQHN